MGKNFWEKFKNWLKKVYDQIVHSHDTPAPGLMSWVRANLGLALGIGAIISAIFGGPVPVTVEAGLLRRPLAEPAYT